MLFINAVKLYRAKPGVKNVIIEPCFDVAKCVFPGGCFLRDRFQNFCLIRPRSYAPKCVKLLVSKGSVGGLARADKGVIFSTFMAAKIIVGGEIFTAFSTTDRRKRIKPKVTH